MQILLIGKYPPCQGGVAARYHWLYEGLARSDGWQAAAVTIADPPYVTPDRPYNTQTRVTTSVIPLYDDERPWVIPQTDLAVERVVSSALEISDSFRPDLIECNYLAPYGAAATIIAQYLRCPLVLRPAGSDVAKILSWQATRRSLLACLRSASAIFLPPDKIKEFGIDIPNLARVVPLPRYVPDPSAFNAIPPTALPVLLVTGKVNYHWRLRALDTLVEAFKGLPNWRLHLVMDGLYVDDLHEVIRSRLKLNQYCLSRFVAPAEIPSLMQQAWAVWNVQRCGGVEDFPNTHWEALASGRYSFLSPVICAHPDMKAVISSPLSIEICPDDAQGLRTTLSNLTPPSSSWSRSHLVESFADYLNLHRMAYESVI